MLFIKKSVIYLHSDNSNEAVIFKQIEIMKNSIKLQIKSVYGNEMIYPACETSKTLANLTGKKTLNRNDLEMIESLGYVIEWVNAYIFQN